MKATKTTLDGLIILEPTIFSDERGYFYESYNEQTFIRLGGLGVDAKFVQDNVSKSHKNVIRGLHYQVGEYAQDKLVRVSNGAVLDIAVDIRPDSPTYGKWEGFLLSRENNRMLFIPKGFAHGFVAITDDAVFNYKCSNVYNKESEGGIIWNDPTIGIHWPTQEPIISEKDLKLPKFGEHVRHY
jgi:dTDP-4-dehydrorhamnose 3,5-epimerase